MYNGPVSHLTEKHVDLMLPNGKNAPVALNDIISQVDIAAHFTKDGAGTPDA